MSDIDPDELREAARTLGARSRDGEVLTQDELHDIADQLEAAADRIEGLDDALGKARGELYEIRFNVDLPDDIERSTQRTLDETSYESMEATNAD